MKAKEPAPLMTRLPAPVSWPLKRLLVPLLSVKTMVSPVKAPDGPGRTCDSVAEPMMVLLVVLVPVVTRAPLLRVSVLPAVALSRVMATLEELSKTRAPKAVVADGVLTVNVDDYAEVWVNGEMPRAAGRPSPAAIQGFNMPNRLVLANTVEVGERFEVAVFAINGPISAAPANFLWFREAKVEFFR